MTLGDKLKIGLVAVVVAAIVAVPGYSYFVSDTVRTKVTSTEVKRYKNSDKYLVFTKAGVFENTDAWYRLKWNSSDMHNKAKGFVGQEVEIEKYGWRIPFLSMYENVVDVTPVNPKIVN